MQAPKKLPFMYLGIGFDDATVKLIIETLQNSLNQLREKYNKHGHKFLGNNEDSLFSLVGAFLRGDDLKNFSSNYSICKNIHITTYFMGKNFSDFSNPYYANFESNIGKEVSVEIIGFVIVPDKIIGCIVRTDEFVTNKYPHITIALCKGVAPKDTNDLMMSSFENGCPFNEFYNDTKPKPTRPYRRATRDLQFKGEKTEAFLNLIVPLKIKGFLRGFKY